MTRGGFKSKVISEKGTSVVSEMERKFGGTLLY